MADTKTHDVYQDGIGNVAFHYHPMGGVGENVEFVLENGGVRLSSTGTIFLQDGTALGVGMYPTCMAVINNVPVVGTWGYTITHNHTIKRGRVEVK